MQPLATMEPAPEPEPLARPSVARRTRAAAWLRAADRAELADLAHGDARRRLVRAPPPFALRALHEPEAAVWCPCSCLLGELGATGPARGPLRVSGHRRACAPP